MVEPTIKIHGINESEERLRAIIRGIPEADFRAMSRAAKHLERRVKENLRAGRHGLRSRKTLRQSFTSAAFVQGKKAVGVVGSNLVYARIHELGGTIRPVKAGALTIPMRRKAGARGARASDYPNAFILRLPGRGAYLVRKVGTGLDFLFVLKKQVRIRAKHYLERTQKEEQTKLVQLLNREVQAVIGTGGTA